MGGCSSKEISHSQVIEVTNVGRTSTPTKRQSTNKNSTQESSAARTSANASASVTTDSRKSKPQKQHKDELWAHSAPPEKLSWGIRKSPNPTLTAATNDHDDIDEMLLESPLPAREADSVNLTSTTTVTQQTPKGGSQTVKSSSKSPTAATTQSNHTSSPQQSVRKSVDRTSSIRRDTAASAQRTSSTTRRNSLSPTNSTAMSKKSSTTRTQPSSAYAKPSIDVTRFRQANVQQGQQQQQQQQQQQPIIRPVYVILTLYKNCLICVACLFWTKQRRPCWMKFYQSWIDYPFRVVSLCCDLQSVNIVASVSVLKGVVVATFKCFSIFLEATTHGCVLYLFRSFS